MRKPHRRAAFPVELLERLQQYLKAEKVELPPDPTPRRIVEGLLSWAQQRYLSISETDRRLKEREAAYEKKLAELKDLEQRFKLVEAERVLVVEQQKLEGTRLELARLKPVQEPAKEPAIPFRVLEPSQIISLAKGKTPAEQKQLIQSWSAS